MTSGQRQNGCNSSGGIIAAREEYGREKEKAQAVI